MNDRWKGCGYAIEPVVEDEGEWLGLVEELVTGRLVLDGGTKYMSDVCTVLGRRAGKRL